jgi:hypothetical protein
VWQGVVLAGALRRTLHHAGRHALDAARDSAFGPVLRRGANVLRACRTRRTQTDDPDRKERP